MKGKHFMILAIDAEKAFGKLPIYDKKALSKIGIEGMNSNIVKAMYYLWHNFKCRKPLKAPPKAIRIKYSTVSR